jgi:hypothetical protein
MREARENTCIWPLYLSTLLAIVIVVTVGWSEYKAYDLGVWVTICAVGFLVWFVWFALSRKEERDPARPKPELETHSEGMYLGEFCLNGHVFEAYEQETVSGRAQFRLRSTSTMKPEREAAFIRYLVNEGLIENMWPEMSRKIEEEAN